MSSPNPYWEKLLGTINSFFRLGFTGPRLKDESGNLGVRLFDDSAYAKARVGNPIGDDDAVNLRYTKTVLGFVIIAGQADTSGGLGTNTGTAGYYVVTTPGSGANLGDLIYDDGTGIGSRTIVVALANRTIVVKTTLSGGVITFQADSIYTWDADSSTWLLAGDVSGLTGPLRTLRKAINFSAANQDTTFQFPANARVYRVRIEITTPYNSGVTLSTGIVGNSTLFSSTSDVNPQSADVFIIDLDVSVGASAVAARVALGNTLSAGAGIVTFYFSIPN